MEAARIGTAVPVRDVKQLTRLLCDKVETVDPGFGIELMRLTATLAEPLVLRQVSSSLTEEPDADVSELIDVLSNRVREAFGDRAYIALTLRRRPNDQLRLHELSNLATRARVPTVVTNDVLFHSPARRILQDVVTCIRHITTIDEAGFLRERHADRYIKPPDEMARLFCRYPEALVRTIEIGERCRFSLDELAYQSRKSAPCQALRLNRPWRSSLGKAPLRAIRKACLTKCVAICCTN